MTEVQPQTSTSEGVIEQFVLEPLVYKSEPYVNDTPRPNGKEITSKRRKAKRSRAKDFEAIAAQNEALYDAEMSKRMRTAQHDTETPQIAELPMSPLSSNEPPEMGWFQEDKVDNYSFVRDPFTMDLEQLLREGEPREPEHCWACKVVNDNSPYAVFNDVWLEFMAAVEDLLSTGATIANMGLQLYKLFHEHIIVKVRDISNGQCEVTGNFENEEVWSAYSIMHHFLVHNVTPERLQWVLIKRYNNLINIQFRGGVVKQHKESGRECVDQKGLETINSLTENLKKVYTWDTKKMCYSNNNKKTASSSISPQTGIFSGKLRFHSNSIRRNDGGKGKPW